MLEQESLTRNDFFFLMTRHMVFLLNNNTQIGITFPFPSWCMHAFVLSHVWLFATPWTVARRTPLSMEFSRQEYWNGLPSPSPGDLPEPGIEPLSLESPALAGMFFTSWGTGEAPLLGSVVKVIIIIIMSSGVSQIYIKILSLSIPFF